VREVECTPAETDNSGSEEGDGRAAVYSVAVVEVAAVELEVVAGRALGVELRKEVESVVGCASAAQRYSYCHYCDSY